MSEYFVGLDKSAIEEAIRESISARSRGLELHEITASAGKPRDHFILYDEALHPLKAVLKKAMELRGIDPKDPLRRHFRTHDGRKYLEELGFKWVQLPSGETEVTKDYERYRRTQHVLARPQQATFRAYAISCWHQTCPITQCCTPSALEAAHILPVAVGGSDEVDNGILLRADLHRLFDQGLMRLSTETFCVSFSDEVDDGYDCFHGITVDVPVGLNPKRFRENLRNRYKL